MYTRSRWSSSSRPATPTRGYGASTGVRNYEYSGYISFDVVHKDAMDIPERHRGASTNRVLPQAKSLIQAARRRSWHGAAARQPRGRSGGLLRHPRRSVELITEDIRNGLVARSDNNYSNRSSFEFRIMTTRSSRRRQSMGPQGQYNAARTGIESVSVMASASSPRVMSWRSGRGRRALANDTRPANRHGRGPKDAWTKDELQVMARDHGLDDSGNKEELAKRIYDHDPTIGTPSVLAGRLREGRFGRGSRCRTLRRQGLAARPVGAAPPPPTRE